MIAPQPKMKENRLASSVVKETCIVIFWISINLGVNEVAWKLITPQYCGRSAIAQMILPKSPIKAYSKSVSLVCAGYERKFSLWFSVTYAGWLAGYLLTTIFFCVVEKTKLPASIYATKMLAGRKQPIMDGPLAWHLMKVWFLYGPLLFLLTATMGIYLNLPNEFGLQRYLASTVILEHFPGIVSYYMHRLLHWGPMYTRFHKMHHTHLYSTIATASYQNWFETLAFSSHLLIWILICRTDLISTLIHVVFIGFNDVALHAAYETSWAWHAKHHLIHHLVPTKNFGYAPWMDEMHGTAQFEFPSWVLKASDSREAKED